ncbi:hypothetical protein AO242_20910 [Pseudomonas sp. ICMP 561]|nr:hypothetical protein AO242_20910 [Pseudomonas sp. ICMP 561]
MLGNGPGLPLAYLIAGAVLLCFSIGYCALVAEFPGSGAFYLYIRNVFGERVGMGAALVALVSYTALTASVAAGMGYFTDLVFSSFGVSLGWKVWAAIGFCIVSVLGRLSADLGAKVLLIIVASEFLILIGLDLAAVAQDGIAALPAASFAPEHLLVPGIGVALMVGFTSFIGFESAALYSAESKDPKRSIPRATVMAVLLISIFYFITSWIIVGTLGVDTAREAAIKLQGEVVGEVIKQRCGEWVALLASVMLCASIFASYLSLQNAASRYALALSQQGCLPRYFSVVSTRNGAPARASTLISVVVALALIIPALQGASPYLTLGASSAALATLGIVLLQAFVAAAIIVHFFTRLRERRAVVITAVIALVGLLATALLVVQNYSLLTGSEDGLANYLPWSLVLFFAYGMIRATRRSPDV